MMWKTKCIQLSIIPKNEIVPLMLKCKIAILTVKPQKSFAPGWARTTNLSVNSRTR